VLTAAGACAAACSGCSRAGQELDYEKNADFINKKCCASHVLDSSRIKITVFIIS
jgi:hypothetical protein